MKNSLHQGAFNYDRLPDDLKVRMTKHYFARSEVQKFVEQNKVYLGDCRELLPKVQPNSVALSVWSPPYFVGKNYESDLNFDQWQNLIAETIALHFSVLKP
jgi:site-specific DNA-methyltransferase (adenine-specific)